MIIQFSKLPAEINLQIHNELIETKAKENYQKVINEIEHSFMSLFYLDRYACYTTEYELHFKLNKTDYLIVDYVNEELSYTHFYEILYEINQANNNYKKFRKLCYLILSCPADSWKLIKVKEMVNKQPLIDLYN